MEVKGIKRRVRFPRPSSIIEVTMPDNHLVFYVKLYVKPERAEEWGQAFQEIVETMSKEEAFISCDLHQDAQDKNLFTL
ncbi:MAG: antibiotic biosynthesis monooxygenase [Pseudomonadales bacterium]|nr:antibiotic biosynthesis monooxygenase [Pseudomonadales bacterium]